MSELVRLRLPSKAPIIPRSSYALRSVKSIETNRFLALSVLRVGDAKPADTGLSIENLRSAKRHFAERVPIHAVQRRVSQMSDAYIVQVGGDTAGIVVRDNKAETFSFFAATHKFNALERRQFIEPYAAERAARQLIAESKSAGEVELRDEVS
jgi:hypothetical protein